MAGYSKEKIRLLYEKYIETSDDKIFEKLMEEVEPIIDIVLTSYGKFGRHFSDLRQEMRLKMWKYLRNPKRLEKFKNTAVTYLFSCIRAYTVKNFETTIRIFKDDKESMNAFPDEKVTGEMKNSFNVEKKYLLKIAAEDFVSRIEERIKRGRDFKKSLMVVQEKVLEKYQEKAHFDLERLIPAD